MKQKNVVWRRYWNVVDSLAICRPGQLVFVKFILLCAHRFYESPTVDGTLRSRAKNIKQVCEDSTVTGTGINEVEHNQ